MVCFVYYFFFKKKKTGICRYEKQLESFCKLMDPLLDSPPPETAQNGASFNDRLKDKLRKSAFWASFMRQALSLGQKDLV
jgi:hypothetical protein